MKKLIITKMPVIGNEMIVAAKCEDFKLRQIDFDCMGRYHIGDIFVGKVKNIVKNIQAAFVEIGKGVECYLPLSDLNCPVYLNKFSNKKALVAGDELLVQIVKEAVKNKTAVATSNLSFSGKYLVVSKENKCIGISKKITGDKSSQLKKFVLDEISKYNNFDFGVIIRTNAKDASMQQIADELKTLKETAEKVLSYGIHRTCYSKVYEVQPEHLLAIKNCYMENLDEIVTDDAGLYDEIQCYLNEFQKEDAYKLHLYKESMLPLYKLYNLPNQIEDASKKKVWLKSGGYLIIEQTEAMVVVDVNTGKFDGQKKDRQENFLKINKEAAIELANQLILRNLSGMILIDFISMENKQYIEELIEVLKAELKKDPIKTEFVDITKLGIVELTRKKQKKPLKEIINSMLKEKNYET